ncbi:hypothetical protein CLV52_0646 [Amnibacterium kyonggiense]|uniref:Uncharacterized protein n=1 Tax=Amnibacterium kyonggiense TaxID=595671 RepID=A0A4R7FQQ9_9MICO|nr:hypothetical protein CLV52_0646 [Amnibacterium kyonggiense]
MRARRLAAPARHARSPRKGGTWAGVARSDQPSAPRAKVSQRFGSPAS